MGGARSRENEQGKSQAKRETGSQNPEKLGERETESEGERAGPRAGSEREQGQQGWGAALARPSTPRPRSRPHLPLI